jgi:hypothetical protein
VLSLLLLPPKTAQAKLTITINQTGNSVNCYYCPKCTTHIYHHQEVMGPDTIIARTGIPADARKKFEVAAEIYGKDKLSWEPKIAETFDVLPPS